MTQFFVWAAAFLSVIYGALTSFAGFGQTKQNKIQTWAAWGLVLCGVLVIAAGLMAALGFTAAIWILFAGLLGIHALAINNGIKMFGKINPSHHLARLLVSAVLVIATYLGMK